MKQALVLVEVHAGLEGNVASVWVIRGTRFIPENLEAEPSATRLQGPIPYATAETLADATVRELVGLGMQVEKAVTVDD